MVQAVAIYETLGAEARETVQAAVARIVALQRSLVTNVVEIGSALVQVKEAVGHGKFGPWLKAEFNWTERTAQNFMSVAERLGSNYESVSHLPLATVYRLAAPATPQDLREKIVARLEGGDSVESTEIDAEIATARREAQREREHERKLAKKSPEARRRAEASRERQKVAGQRRAEEWKAERERREANRAEAAALIIRSMNEADVDRLLELLGDAGAITRPDILTARQSMGDRL